MIVLELGLAALALSLVMAAAWLAQRRTGQSGWIDAIWSLAVGSIGAALALAPMRPEWLAERQVLVVGLALLWSMRLGWHIAARTRRGGEDPRYKALADEWGEDFPRRLFWVLQIQAAAAFPLVATIFMAAQNLAPFPGLADWLGGAILLMAIGGEAIADAELRRFGADPANKAGVCEVGLWRFSRHPNYFFEWLGWIAYPVIAIGWPPNPWGAIALAGPVLMYWLLVHVSGVPLLEAHMARSRGAAFTDYQARVNVFFPGPPRR